MADENLSERCLAAIYAALDEINEEREAEGGQAVGKAEDTRLLGRDAALDSLELVRFILGLEEVLLDELDVSLTLADEKAMSRNKSPFRSVLSLREYLVERVTEQSDD